MQIRLEKLNEMAVKESAKKQSKSKMKYISAAKLVNEIVERALLKKDK